MAGIGMLGHRYAFACVKQEGGSRVLSVVKGRVTAKDYAGEAEEEILDGIVLPKDGCVWIRMHAKPDSVSFSYSTDGKAYADIEGCYEIDRATWTGVKVALAARNGENRVSKGCCDVDYIRFTAEEQA